MTSIAIDRLNARYRIPQRAMRERPRLQRIMTDTIEHVLEGAVDRAGIERRGYVCVRDVRASVRLRLREPDSMLSADLGQAIADAIRTAVEERSPSVVSYSSRVHALID